MLKRLRAAATELLGLFVTDWLFALLTLAILAGGWGLSRSVHSAAVGFTMAAALALSVVAEALVSARRLRRTGGG